MLDRLKAVGLSINWVTGSFLLVILFLLLPLPVDNLKYIAVSFLVSGYGVYSLTNKDFRFQLPQSKVIIGLAAYVSLSFGSTMWATDTSMALRESFIWLLFSLMALSISSLVRGEYRFEYYISKMFAIFFMLFLMFHLGAFQFDIALNSDWNELMSKNKEYTTTLLTCLSPFLLFYPSKSQFVRFLKVVSIVLLVNLLFLTGARGALLAFSMILLLKYWNFYAEWKYRYFGVLLGAILIVSGIYILNTSKASSQFLFVQEYRTELASRVQMNKNSIASISERPIIGVGSGQWYNDIYRHGVGDTAPFNATQDFVRYRSHNLYFKQLVEVGFVGFILFFGCLTGVLWKYRDRWTELSGYQKAAWGSLMSYLIVVYFYANAVPYEYFFSAITLVAFVSLGVLLGGVKSASHKITFLPYVIVLLSITTSAWYIFSKVKDDQFRAIVISEKENENPSKQDLEDLYHPIFHATHNHNTSISQMIAEGYHGLQNNEKAESYYKLALDQTPYNEDLLRSYIDFSLRSNTNTEKAKECLKVLLSIHPNFNKNLELEERMRRTE